MNASRIEVVVANIDLYEAVSDDARGHVDVSFRVVSPAGTTLLGGSVRSYFTRANITLADLSDLSLRRTQNLLSTMIGSTADRPEDPVGLWR